MQTLRDRFAMSGVQTTPELVDGIRRIARPLGRVEDLDPLLDRVGDARTVLLGEASHGTAEYYEWRTAVTRRLVEEKGFRFVAVEGDWPDCYAINRYVKGWPNAARSAREVLDAYERWPTWMWANREVEVLVGWLRAFNDGRTEEEKVGFYGLDVYSLWDSLDAVTAYLEQVDPDALPTARRAYGCFEPYREDEIAYARSTALVPRSCEAEVVSILRELRDKAAQYREKDPEAFFDAEQNALVAGNAELYYRTMVQGGPTSWNVRDTHMADTLDRLMERHGEGAKAVVWEHNTHIGDARATDMAAEGMVNVGQLVRERHGVRDTVLVGFGSHRGSVIAGAYWGAPMEELPVPPAKEGSYEDALHAAGGDDKLLILSDAASAEQLFEPRGHRAIGVVYDPGRERRGNYVPTVLPLRYDAFLYLDETSALHPLHREPELVGEAETYPTGV